MARSRPGAREWRRLADAPWAFLALLLRESVYRVQGTAGHPPSSMKHLVLICACFKNGNMAAGARATVARRGCFSTTPCTSVKRAARPRARESSARAAHGVPSHMSQMCVCVELQAAWVSASQPLSLSRSIIKIQMSTQCKLATKLDQWTMANGNFAVASTHASKHYIVIPHASKHF